MPKEPMVPTPPDAAPQAPGAPGAAVPEGVPRIVRASLESRPRSHHAAEAVLEKLNRGIVIFDADGCVLFVNRAASRLMHESGAIDVVEGALAFADAACQARLIGYLRRPAGRADSVTGQSSIVMRVSAGPAAAPYRVLLSPLETPADPGTGAGDRLHVLMIYEPNAGLRLPLRILTELYGLSEAEASVAELLFEGLSLESTAQRLHISINTAKTHLHHVFVKCEVHSQGELLQLLSLGPRAL